MSCRSFVSDTYVPSLGAGWMLDSATLPVVVRDRRKMLLSIAETNSCLHPNSFSAKVRAFRCFLPSTTGVAGGGGLWGELVVADEYITASHQL